MKKIVYLFILMGFIACNSGNKSLEPAPSESMSAELIETTINVGGMHCDMCVSSIEKGINELHGISFVKASLDDSTAVVKFDKAQTNLEEIKKAIEKRGYTIQQ
jgi:copper chaperone